MNLKSVILAAACALAHGVWAADAPLHECRWTDEAIKLDGTADEPAWREARVIDDFRFPWHPKDKKRALATTKARLLWDREYLYVFAELDDADLHSHVTEQLGDLRTMGVKPARGRVSSSLGIASRRMENAAT